jgi:hypothetical protein
VRRFEEHCVEFRRKFIAFCFRDDALVFEVAFIATDDNRNVVCSFRARQIAVEDLDFLERRTVVNRVHNEAFA